MAPFTLHCGACGRPFGDGDHVGCARLPAGDHAPIATIPDADRAALLADICAALGQPAPLTSVPAQRYRLKYGVMECVQCGYAKEFCACARQPALAQPSADASAEQNLEQRARECKGK